ncbi:MAG: cysteine synthase A [Leptospiraceae bacterium]|nr:cysteine synthase A [Leptospiraceae bacterium]
MKAENILATIGNTPHVKINNLYSSQAEVYIKLERANPGGSIKDRIALAMIEDAEKKGILKKDSVIIEPTSGNTGVGLAMVAAVKKYPLILVMPESMSIERRRLMSAYGAQFELTPREKGMPGAIEKAKQMVAERTNAWMPSQFDNEANVQVHIDTTASEILKDFPNGVDYLITGVGTGGHITGVAKVLKEKFPKVKVFAVEPALSPVITATLNKEPPKPGPHPIQGIGAGFIPANLDLSFLDGVIQVSKEEAFEYAVRAAKEEGMFLGVSSGASLAAVAKKVSEFSKGQTVLTFCYDTGERYLSIEGLFT